MAKTKRRRLLGRSIIGSILKLAIMALLLRIIWRPMILAWDGIRHGSHFFDGFWDLMSVLLMLAGMTLGAMLSLKLFSTLRLPRFINAILSFVIIIASTLLIEKGLMWVYQYLFEFLGSVIGLVVILILMGVVICGAGKALMLGCFLLLPGSFLFGDDSDE